MTLGHKWQPIADLPSDPSGLTDGELESLQRVWRSQKELIEGASFDEFVKRLRREWAIETGIIEDVYTLDRGITRTLIEKGIDAALIPHNASNKDSILVRCGTAPGLYQPHQRNPCRAFAERRDA